MVASRPSLFSLAMLFSLAFSISCSSDKCDCSIPVLQQDGTEWTADARNEISSEVATMDTLDLSGFDMGSMDWSQGSETSENCSGDPPYPFSCPCEQNSDCQTGFCVESPFGFVCTEECLEECPDGWFCRGITGFGADLVFLCIPQSKKLCYPCEQDSQCGGGRCVEMDDGTFCTYECDPNESLPCATSFQCVSATFPGGSADVCMPESGSCGCTNKTVGQMQPCENSNEHGTCLGYAKCDPTQGWVECSALIPSEEICDGVDNDCDGAIDEGLPESKDCENSSEGIGSCSGKAFCYGSLGWVCTAQEPTEEICDYSDNNCDGSIDEPFINANGDYVAQEHCGSCGVSCEVGFPNAEVVVCDANREPPQCVVSQCAPGYNQLNEFQCVPWFSNLCQPCNSDDNCPQEGDRCVEMNDGSYCTTACVINEDCPAGYGCTEYEGTTQCIPLTNSCTCDGTNTLLSKSCSTTWPPSPLPGQSTITCYGLQKCTESGWTDCELPEESCDGADNDCNGVIDDGFLVDGKYSTDENCGECGNNCGFLTYDNAYGACDASLDLPQCKMVCSPGFGDVNQNPIDGCECGFVSDEDLPDGIDQNCDTVDGEIDNAIFVAKNGSDLNSGTREEPVLTIAQALALAASEGKRDVYVATGVYPESLLLASNVGLYGGYSSNFATRDIVLYETVIMGLPSTTELPGAVNCIDTTGTNQGTVLDGFTIYGSDNAASGASSYAVYIRNCDDTLAVSYCRVFAGDGGNGAPGSQGTEGTNGTPGTVGIAAENLQSSDCNPVTGFLVGGVGGVSSCGDVDVSGGMGGESRCPHTGAPDSEEMGMSGAGPQLSQGGEAGWDGTLNFACNSCTQPSNQDEPRSMDGGAGSSGAMGTPGMAGSGCSNAAGSVVDGLWLAPASTDGEAGIAGSGGGGGGAGGGADRESYSPACADQFGGSGGGGGAGGCPGSGGVGGTGGGGSFGFFLVFDEIPAGLPQLVANVTQGGVGGNGGAGGNGGTGGVGGNGGEGGSGGTAGGEAWCARSGGKGGDGGRGGHGGGGGGGCGGPSYCLFIQTPEAISSDAIQDSATCIMGSGGFGGSGGLSLGNPGDSGANGATAEVGPIL